MGVYYNEIDEYAVAWLRNLISNGLIPDGDVDSRSIVDVQPEDLNGYTQHHFFAGIAGWALAARLAGWPDDREIVTGSCPCQGESVAGKKLGADDPRHLWPDFFRLIRARRPPVVMGEQVSRAAGTHWLDGVWTDMENENYAFRAIDIPACAVDAPHIRSRLWWIAERLADAEGISGKIGRPGGTGAGPRQLPPGGHYAVGSARLSNGSLDHADGAGRQGRTAHGGDDGQELQAPERADVGYGSNGSWWANHEWIRCHDGKARRTEPSIPMLVVGLSKRVALWRGFGNAISPVLAAEVIKAYMDTRP